MGVPELLILLLLLLLITPAAWLVVRAKPLVPNPYHWGQWCAIGSAYSAITVLAIPVGHPNANWPTIGALALLMAAAAIGLFRRKRLGALSYRATYLVCAAMSNSLGASGGLLIAAMINAIYFQKRWNDMEWW